MIVDWGAGPGGWDVGAASLDLRPVGLEMGEAECATRAAAGHLSIRCDASSYPAAHLRGLLQGFICSTPCPDFSKAGKRQGLRGLTGALVFELLRWSKEARPRWIAAENVDDVAPIFRSFRAPLAALGYSVWSGVLDAADYGVPQNRKRAFLLASLDRRVGPPPPTHSKTGASEMFGGSRLRWVSMAEALGWIDDERIVESYGPDAHSPTFDPAKRPARTICGARSPRWLYEDGDRTHGAVLRTGSTTDRASGRERYERSVDRPSPTIDTKAGRSNWKLRHPGRSYTSPSLTRSVERPAPTVALGHNVVGWCWDRPATTVQGTPRIALPSHHEQQWKDKDAVKVELWELGVLQGFPPDYPWMGNKTERARQVGNAVPPPLAAAVLSCLIDPPNGGKLDR